MRGELYLVLATLLAAIGWGSSKIVVLEVPGDIFIAARFLLAGLVLLPFCYKQLRILTQKQFVYLIGVGGVLSLSLQVWVHAVSITDSLAEGAFIMSLAMIIAPFTSWLLFRIKPTRAFWIALPVAIVGMMLLTLNNGWRIEKSQIVFLVASALLSIHFVLNKRSIKSVSPLLSICIQLFVVGVSGALYVQFNSHPLYEPSSHVWIWFTISTIVATALRYLVQTLGQFSVKIETASLIMILEPIWTLFISFMILNESIEQQKLIGGLVIFLSLFVYTKLSNREVPKLRLKR